MKTQATRAADVLFVGPSLLLAGVYLARNNRPLLGSTLGALGLLTLVYNVRDYARVAAT